MSEIVTAGILVIGDEILSGRTKDKNIGFIAEYLTNIGIDLKEVRVVADDEADIIAALDALRKRYDYVFTTGGIGPTHDDITADSVAKAFSVGIDHHPEVVARFRERWSEQDLNEARLRMARVPDGAELIQSATILAPGFKLGNVIVMAGVPISLGLSLMAQRLLARGVRSRVARGWYTAGCLLVVGIGMVSLLDAGMPLSLRLVVMTLSLGCTPIAYGLCPALLAEVTPGTQRGAMLAIGNSVASLAGVISPVVMGRLVQDSPGAHGYELGFALCGVLSIAGSVAGAILTHPERSLRRLSAAARRPRSVNESTTTVKSANPG